MMLRTWTRLAGVAALAALTVGAAGTGVAHADGTTSQTSQTSHSITAVGDGVVEGTPNVLELELRVTTRDPSAAAALAHNSELAVKVIGELKNAGVADKDVQTSNLSISPNVSGSGNHVDGYEVDNTVTAKLRDVNKGRRHRRRRHEGLQQRDRGPKPFVQLRRQQQHGRRGTDAGGQAGSGSGPPAGRRGRGVTGQPRLDLVDRRSGRTAHRDTRRACHTEPVRGSDAPGQPRFADGVGGGDPRVPDRLTSPAGRPR
jgi:hypothetical protein